MWYALQISIAFGCAYFWTTMPGNTPADFGRGLYLGGIIAFMATLTITAFTTLIRALVSKLLRRLQRSKVGTDVRLCRGSHEKPDQVVPISDGSSTRTPKLISKITLD